MADGTDNIPPPQNVQPPTGDQNQQPPATPPANRPPVVVNHASPDLLSAIQSLPDKVVDAFREALPQASSQPPPPAANGGQNAGQGQQPPPQAPPATPEVKISGEREPSRFAQWWTGGRNS